MSPGWTTAQVLATSRPHPLSLRRRVWDWPTHSAGLRVSSDRRDNYTPGWKYNFWELRVGGWARKLYCPQWRLYCPSPLALCMEHRACRPPPPSPPPTHTLCTAVPQGIPLRVELGPKDMEGGCAMLARRDTGAKESCPWDSLAARVPALLQEMQVGVATTLLWS